MSEGGVVITNSRGQRRHPLDARIAAVAGRQHSTITRAQLLRLGATGREVDYRLEISRLHPVHRGVYAVGHPVLADHGVWLAAVLALGPGAVLSHRAAGTLVGFLRKSKHDRSPPTDVTVPRRLKPREGIRPHVARNLRSSDVTKHEGIPVTTAARTLLDLSALSTRTSSSVR